MKTTLHYLLLAVLLSASLHGSAINIPSDTNSVVRVNLLGYPTSGIKVAVWGSKKETVPDTFAVISVKDQKTVYRRPTGEDFGSYGPFVHSLRLNFSDFSTPGTYFLQLKQDGKIITSPHFQISDSVYKGAADFCLKYLRQQRSGFNPYLRDSCHTQDGFTVYGPMPEGTFVDVSGGWHDASDYLQYVTTSATADYYLLSAWRDFPQVFADRCQANGLPGRNGIKDVLDEARWGLDWLLKMHPRPDWFFNQIADDRDHAGFRLPSEDSVDYGHGLERPVYFLTGEPQGLGNHTNHTTGAASTAGKFAACFALGAKLYQNIDTAYAKKLKKRALSSYQYGLDKPGYTQTACNVSPYYYTEMDWQDDMELGGALLAQLTGNNRFMQQAVKNAKADPQKKWMGKDTMTHYQWYPFYNAGHYELSKITKGAQKARLMDYYRQSIEAVWQKAKENAFYRGVPFVWCSNNLTAAFAIQCYLYRRTTGDTTYRQLEQASVDWLLGCNPWGTTMVAGLPAGADHPSDPHSAFWHLCQYPVDGGLVDGPVYGSIYSGLIGVHLSKPDVYAPFQSSLAVYHDDYADYSTNEPTTDGTATMLYLLAAQDAEARLASGFSPLKKKVFRFDNVTVSHGGIIRGDSAKKEIALVFTGHRFADGGQFIARFLENAHLTASFFFTGYFYKHYPDLIRRLQKGGNYLGSHSYRHLLYCPWENRDSLLVSKTRFLKDLDSAYQLMRKFGISRRDAPYFLPPYEWYNDRIAAWTKRKGLQLVNFSPGTYSNADYTYPQMGKKYFPSDTIFSRIVKFEEGNPSGLNGFILLFHIGTDPRRTDKFYKKLPALTHTLKQLGYKFVTINDMLKKN